MTGLCLREGIVTNTLYETSTDGYIYFNQGWKEFLIGTGLGVGTNVLIAMKTNVLNELNMMVALDTI